jgi:hypothetical protein
MNGVIPSIERAAGCVDRARRNWDSSVLAECTACVAELEQAEAALRTVQKEAGSGSAPEAAARLECVREDLAALARLVDAAIAFHRGLALHSGAVPTES